MRHVDARAVGSLTCDDVDAGLARELRFLPRGVAVVRAAVSQDDDVVGHVLAVSRVRREHAFPDVPETRGSGVNLQVLPV